MTSGQNFAITVKKKNENHVLILITWNVLITSGEEGSIK